jgi:AcrR family transcriptional regulator
MTSSNRRLTPRKQPKQTRSEQTRERILEAAAHVFAQYGYAAGTTNRIAADAGLSIGSLYQYFPNKDSILVALVRRHVAEGAELLANRLGSRGLPDGLEARMGFIVDLLIDNHKENIRLHQVLFEEAPRPPELLEEIHLIELQATSLVETILREEPDVFVADIRLAARLVVITAESVVHRYISAYGPDLELGAFRRELVGILLGYLRGDTGSCER